MVDLTLDVQERPDGLHCRFLYNTDLFEAATIARMSGHFQALLEAIVANPRRRFFELLPLTPAERHRLLGGDEEELAGLVAAVKSLSDEEAERLLDASAKESGRNAAPQFPGVPRN
jgi:non-ribosomal peptide synthetase component F